VHLKFAGGVFAHLLCLKETSFLHGFIHIPVHCAGALCTQSKAQEKATEPKNPLPPHSTHVTSPQSLLTSQLLRFF
jgi:hypothetical protein